MINIIKDKLDISALIVGDNKYFVDERGQGGRAYSIEIFGGNIYIRDLDKAYLTATSLPRYSIDVVGGKENVALYHFMKTSFGEHASLSLLIKFLENCCWRIDPETGIEYCRVPIPDAFLECRRSHLQATRVFSPFNLDRLNPVKQLPAKITLNQVKRLLGNEQYCDLQCDLLLSDDFARDNETDYGRRAVDGLEFLHELMDDNVPWRVLPESTQDRIRVACHTFKFMSFTPVLEPPSTDTEFSSVRQPARTG